MSRGGVCMEVQDKQIIVTKDKRGVGAREGAQDLKVMGMKGSRGIGK